MCIRDSHQAVGVVRRQHARAAASHPRRQGAGAHGRALQRELRGHPCAGETGAAPPRAYQFPRAIGAGDVRPDHRQAAAGGAGAQVGDVNWRLGISASRHLGRAAEQPSSRAAMTTSVTPANPAQTSFLDPSVLARIGNLELLARTVVEGFINGLHRSPHLGASTDFAEHRAYMPGDDIRRIDWKLYARSDRHYIKEYEADTNTNFIVVLDTSPSMRYGATAQEDGGRVSKLTYGCYLAACLAYFSSLQRDRVGMATIDHDIVDYVPPSAKHLNLLLHTLDRIEKKGRDSKVTPGRSLLEPPLRKLSDTLRRRSLVVVISDFYEDVENVTRALT